MIMKENPAMSCKDTALQYLTKGYSVIPIKPNKKPFIQWEEFQKRQPAQDEVLEWWRKWPSANVAIITGKLSDICAIDVDEEKGFEAIQDYIPDSLIIPTSKTPKGGQHLYFKMPKKSIGNNSRLIPGCDFRGEGGYIIAPPSKGYSWLDGLSIEEIETPSLPIKYINYLNSLYIREENAEHNKALQTITPRNITFDEPGRDESLFHLANHLVKAGMPLANIEKYLTFFAAHCNPPFPPKETDAKIKSALERAERCDRNITQEVREFVMSSWGAFLSRDVEVRLGLSSRKDQQAIYWGLKQMLNEGIIERVEKRNGCYRRIDLEVEEMDFKAASMETVDISMPFDIEEKVELMPGNIVVIAGEPNVGKTAFLLNVVLMNQEKSDIHYFSSEMGASELRKRLSKFDYPLDAWTFKAKERSDNFSDVIVPGQGRINIIDFLEVYDNFYVIGGHLAEIHKKLKGAIAVVAIQKNPGVDIGLGGFRGLEKPRLYLAMSSGKLKIVKAKNWTGSQNPNHLQINFNIVDGCKLISKGEWYYPEDRGK